MPINSLDQILTNSATGMSAQSIRMNTIASNLANADNVGSTPESTYHSKYPIFSEITANLPGLNKADQPTGGVKVDRIQQSTKPLDQRYQPTHPMANKDGYIYVTDVNPIEQMTNMISASKDYQANVEVMKTTVNMIMQSLNVLGSK